MGRLLHGKCPLKYDLVKYWHRLSADTVLDYGLNGLVLPITKLCRRWFDQTWLFCGDADCSVVNTPLTCLWGGGRIPLGHLWNSGLFVM